jgi:hypothetical protein
MTLLEAGTISDRHVNYANHEGHALDRLFVKVVQSPKNRWAIFRTVLTQRIRGVYVNNCLKSY